ncbi:GlxA family transcriptional regulator [Bosea sp. BIWAKO-01]|uniref:GlxA family transcriptional regulator n=1 Tax=Bosea sp. BIWAKO-01 TaxID=506668 RepID=UPI000853CDD9|nr:GlxA family transcriptional regulator [Bosea sp. BIWAKO-01]GAU84681.1 transcriptional regulator containing an amidase domain and an AraC-type DNA-binding HTH domain [Bosea sp. BIWAKO-01]
MHRMGFVVSPGFQLMSFAALSAFEFANLSVPSAFYDVRVMSQSGGAVKSSLGLMLETGTFDDAPYDTMIFGGDLAGSEVSAAMVDFVRRSATKARRVASICTGAFVLAQAGLLDGRQATTHWASSRDLAARYPRIKVDPDRIFIVDGPIWTSAGASAGIDLALGMIEKDLGPEVARLTARKLVVYHRRAGGQSQHSALLDMDAKSDRVQSALNYARSNLQSRLSVEDLADAARLSPRQFSRAFRAETGQSPAKAVENLRVEAARLLMEQTGHPVEAIAEQTGFADRERMRRAFLRNYGQPPQAIRRNARVAG